MDGVLADFNAGAHAAHSRPNVYTTDPAALGVFNIETCWGITAEEFWRPIKVPGFWSSLQPMPEAQQLVDLATKTVGLENIAVLTSPNLDPNCVPEKMVWMYKYFPELAGHMMFARAFAKRLVAAPNHVLIDDYDRNIDQWQAAGGPGILVPRLWNRDWKVADRVYDVIEAKLLPIHRSSAMSSYIDATY